MTQSKAKIAPFINIPFYVTGTYGEQRTTHIHKGVDLSTGSKSPVFSLSSGIVILRTNGRRLWRLYNSKIR